MSERIRSALSHIPSDDREVWVSMAFAVKSELGDSGFDLWDTWSQTADNYRPDSAKSVWKSAKASGGISAGTLFKTAIEHGWRDDGAFRRATPQEIAEQRRKAARRDAEAARERTAEAALAAKKAAGILAQCELLQHAYLHSKGMPEARGLVWVREGMDPLLCVPMRVGSELVGLQLINISGGKKFLKGQRTKGAEFVIGTKGRDFYAEGYATALSVAACLSALNVSARVHACFSAGNLEHMARRGGFVIADNDVSQTGEKAAQATGIPYFMAPDAGSDFNDYHKASGTFAASQALRRFMQSI